MSGPMSKKHPMKHRFIPNMCTDPIGPENGRAFVRERMLYFTHTFMYHTKKKREAETRQAEGTWEGLKKYKMLVKFIMHKFYRPARASTALRAICCSGLHSGAPNFKYGPFFVDHSRVCPTIYAFVAALPHPNASMDSPDGSKTPHAPSSPGH
jgi:hypothetical protein